MNSVVVITICHVLNGGCLSQPINTEISALECPIVVTQFNDEQRSKQDTDQIRAVASCVPQDQFPMEYFKIKQATNE